MIPWETVARARTEGGKQLVLYRRDGEFVIRAGGRELMSSRAHGSEEALAELACGHLGPDATDRPGRGDQPTPPRVLVGGLGLGYTLRAVLRVLPRQAVVVVAEIVPEVVEWVRGPLAQLADRPLGDPRVRVEVADVGRLLSGLGPRFDAILLDVDNGPAALTRQANQALYAEHGLLATRRALRPGGVLAVWSSGPDPRFLRRLRRAGFDAAAHEVPARGVGGGPLHTIFIATMPGRQRLGNLEDRHAPHHPPR